MAQTQAIEEGTHPVTCDRITLAEGTFTVQQNVDGSYNFTLNGVDRWGYDRTWEAEDITDEEVLELIHYHIAK